LTCRVGTCGLRSIYLVEHATRSTERTAALFREAGDKTRQVFDEVAQAADNTELAARKTAARARG